jgi:trehalose-6-phosphate synthase
MDQRHHRLIVVSNRLPFVFHREMNGAWRVEPGSGGLVSALLPVLRHRGGTWIGWPGTSDAPEELDPILAQTSADAGYALQPVHLTAEDEQNFYHGFSNEVIWPLFHDLQSLCNFDPRYWRTYCSVNRKFAQIILSNSNEEDFVWVHDYHLMNIAMDLRDLGGISKIGFFLHIPFPPLDLFVKLPWCARLIKALLEYDLVGFQTSRDRRNFVQCVKALVKGAQIDGKGQIVTATVGAREVRIGAFPIGIDFNAFLRQSATPQVAAKAKELHTLLSDRKLVLGIDRLDYTKGIPHRLNAFQNLLTRYPDLRERISLIQVVVPSRVGHDRRDMVPV